jgi:hypothetical protein
VVPKAFNIPPLVPNTEVGGFDASPLTPEVGGLNPNEDGSEAVFGAAAADLKSLVPPSGVNGVKLTIGREGPLDSNGFPEGAEAGAELLEAAEVCVDVLVGPVN